MVKNNHNENYAAIQKKCTIGLFCVSSVEIILAYQNDLLSANSTNTAKSWVKNMNQL